MVTAVPALWAVVFTVGSDGPGSTRCPPGVVGGHPRAVAFLGYIFLLVLGWLYLCMICPSLVLV